MASGLVFATVGTTKFDSFVSTLMQPDVLNALKKKGYHSLLIQIGNGEVTPDKEEVQKSGIELDFYRFKNSIKEDIVSADLVISHAGAGSCLEVLDQQKPLLVVVNDALMNNHQMELAEQLASDGHLYACTITTLRETVETMDLKKLIPMTSPDSNAFASYLDKYMGFHRKD